MTLRRPLILPSLLILPILAASLTGCGREGDAKASTAPAGQVVHLRFWNGFAGPDGRTMLGIIRKFNDEHPNIRVTMQRTDWATYYNKLFVAGLGGQAPEVFVIHTDTLSRFSRASFVRPVDDLVGGADGIDPADIDANAWDAVEHDGKHYAVPLDVHPMGMFYNRKLFREAGIAGPPTNRAEFMEALRKIKALNRPNTWGFVYNWLRINVYGLMAQNGG